MAPEETKQDFITKLEHFFNTKGQLVSIAFAVVLVVIGATLYFTKSYVPNQEKAAAEEMFQAEQLFAIDSFRLALEGDGTASGFLDIIKSYSFTKAKNLSNYYAGVSYLHLGEYEEAIDHLKQFKSADPILTPIALKAIADAYMQLDEIKKGLSYYQKAANSDGNALIMPSILLDAGDAFIFNNKLDKAFDILQKVEREYPNTDFARKASDKIAAIEGMQLTAIQ